MRGDKLWTRGLRPTGRICVAVAALLICLLAQGLNPCLSFAQGSSMAARNPPGFGAWTPNTDGRIYSTTYPYSNPVATRATSSRFFNQLDSTLPRSNSTAQNVTQTMRYNGVQDWTKPPKRITQTAETQQPVPMRSPFGARRGGIGQ